MTSDKRNSMENLGTNILRSVSNSLSYKENYRRDIFENGTKYGNRKLQA